MTFNSIPELQKEGFSGFKKISELASEGSILPDTNGVYLMLYTAYDQPQFLEVGTGGYFKGKNPNVSLFELQSNWVNDTIVLYIGKATSLKKRLHQYLLFGQGKNIGHYGGRYIWQLKNSQDMIVCWKPIETTTPRAVERYLIQEFIKVFGKRPFANLVG